MGFCLFVVRRLVKHLEKTEHIHALNRGWGPVPLGWFLRREERGALSTVCCANTISERLLQGNSTLLLACLFIVSYSWSHTHELKYLEYLVPEYMGNMWPKPGLFPPITAWVFWNEICIAQAYLELTLCSWVFSWTLMYLTESPKPWNCRYKMPCSARVSLSFPLNCLLELSYFWFFWVIWCSPVFQL